MRRTLAAPGLAAVLGMALLLTACGKTNAHNIKNTSSQTYTMFLQDFQIQWGEGDSDYGTCLNAVDDTMMPYAYELTPGQERSDWLMAEIPDGSTSCTIAYQEYKTDGSKGDAYFVEAAL